MLAADPGLVVETGPGGVGKALELIDFGVVLQRYIVCCGQHFLSG